MSHAHPPTLNVATERWPIAGAFTISRGSKTEAHVVVAEISDGLYRGRGECVPYGRYGETIEGVAATIARMGPEIARGLDRDGLQAALPAGAARNALDCALWDLAAKRAQRPVQELAGLPQPRPLVTAYTISLGTPQAMATAAEKAATRSLLKVKLGQPGDPERIRAVRAAAPRAELIVDANEGWTADNLGENLAACAAVGVTLVEQPLPAEADAILAEIPRVISVCADESVHDRGSLKRLAGKYDAINLKLDKTGGLTEAIALAAEAARLGLELMVGCMISTSLAIAPAMLVAQTARVVDLDGALLLAQDRPDGLCYDGSLVYPATSALWG
ncbi:MAG TPA: N-acetyl-D-Glu racemase DgcA [Xanthobacteraceae bacterium]|jgi:L-alanine-DL-glutamate epimerase-like enolase superfamily enzyme|nr:N-acetyl-D-Glu racemase DgcA [Xanthobacteraceae bacterium]